MKKNLLICLLVSMLTMGVSCSKKQEEASPAETPEQTEQIEKLPDEAAATEQNPAVPEAETEPVQKEDIPKTELDILTEKANSKSQTDVENLARYLFNEANSDFDFVRGCEALRAIEIYESTEMTFRRGWCDSIKGRSELNSPLSEMGIKRMKQAGEAGYIPALEYIIDTGLDLDMSATQKLTQIYKAQLEENKTPENQYLYAKMLLSMPGDTSPEGLELLKSAAQDNYIPAVRALGQVYDSDESRKNEGRELLEKAALAGDRDAITTLISGYDFAVRTAADDEQRNRSTEYMLHWCEKASGHILSCRVLLETATAGSSEKFKSEARKLLIPCLENLEPDRWKCDTMRGFIERNTELSSLPAQMRTQMTNALIRCYEGVIRHGDGHPAVMNTKTPGNAEIIEQLRKAAGQKK